MTLSATASISGPADVRRDATFFDRIVAWAVEARAHRVILLVASIWMLNAFDLAFTVLSHEQGMLHEENPVARHLLGYGTLSIVLFKVGLVLIGTYPLLRFRTARITELGTMVILVAYAVLAMHWSECLELYTITVSHSVALTDLGGKIDLSPLTPD